MTSPRASLPVALLALTVALAAPLRASADEDDERTHDEAGHFSVSGGALAGDDSGSLAFRPLVRAEIAFNVLGPLAAGGFLQVAFADGGPEAPAFGGGVLLTLRPDLPELGFVPHIEITGARLQLPSRADAGIVDAWSAGIGAGVGLTIVTGVSVEARVHHGWYFGMPSTSALSESAWTFGGAMTVDLS